MSAHTWADPRHEVICQPLRGKSPETALSVVPWNAAQCPPAPVGTCCPVFPLTENPCRPGYIGVAYLQNRIGPRLPKMRSLMRRSGSLLESASKCTIVSSERWNTGREDRRLFDGPCSQASAIFILMASSSREILRPRRVIPPIPSWPDSVDRTCPEEASGLP